MIDSALASAIARVADRANDVLHGYQAGFEPRDDVARRRATQVADMHPLSVGVPDDAFFIVSSRGRTSFTRAGELRFDDGTLCTADGSAILGRVTGGTDSRLVPLRVDPSDAALRRLRDARIEPDGNVTFLQSAIEPRTGVRREARVVLGRIAVASFPAGTRLVRLDEGHVAPPKDVAPRAGFPGEGAFGVLRTHTRELGKLDLEAGLRKLQEAYLSLEALRSAYQAHGEVEKGAMDLLK